MPTDPEFVAHAVDLVSLVAPVEARRMFGGHGLFAEGVMFGLLDDGELFLKCDEQSRARFVDAGCRQWQYVNKKVRMVNTGYYRPPDEAHEDPEAMLPWARLALEAALRRQAVRGASAARRPREAAGNAAPPKKARQAPKAARRSRPKRRTARRRTR
jgi:DNA transformation protein and related proteins